LGLRQGIRPYNPKAMEEMIQAPTIYIVVANIKGSEDDHM
jgi:hypothetical protein